MWTPYVESSGGDSTGGGAAEDTLESIDSRLLNLLTLQITAQQEVLAQLRLLNARFEETFETRIEEGDVWLR